MFDLLEGWLRHKSDMVNIEAARAICEMRNVTVQELYRPVAVLNLFLTSPKPVLKFAAIRTLNKLAQTHPAAVVASNHEMENMITDPNRSLATYAITTLLKVRCFNRRGRLTLADSVPPACRPVPSHRSTGSCVRSRRS